MRSLGQMLLGLLGVRQKPDRTREAPPRLDGWIEPPKPNAASLIIEAEDFIGAARDGKTTTVNGPEFAARLVEAARNLSDDERTRYSPQVRWLHLLAAQVALLSFKPGSAELLAYESAVYADQPRGSRKAITVEYQALKAALSARLPEGDR